MIVVVSKDYMIVCVTLVSLMINKNVAISTDCPALNNIVVDSVEVGQTYIEYLRRND
ncbi:9818_t:CDS:2 [Funneliformis caledonium]|uniref:9818_t:CDS:1 n=1 Tax=Funneliformis caledonium TaxID=1117310 RepID=A0A9N9C4I6_9GLOM|nr:9818_t:CDS:2 [Funneliformis caledonium]